MPTLDKYLGKVYLWHYIPSLPAAIVMASLFAIITTAHFWKMWRTRMWFCAPFAIGGLLEVIGYITRAFATYNTGSLIPYLLQSIFLLLPPILFAASLYMVYSRVVRAVNGDRSSIIAVRWTTWIFVGGDWACLNIQGGGAGMLSKKDDKQVRTGELIIIGGLILQILVFIFFMVVCLIFHARFRKQEKQTGARSEVPWRSCLHMLYWTSMLVLVRNVFRVAEYVMGQDGYLFEHEWTTYVFDGAPMLLVMIGFFIWYPSQLKRGSRESSDSMVELYANLPRGSGDGYLPRSHQENEKESLPWIAYVLFPPLLVKLLWPSRKRTN
ncbi:RTA1 like protein-domain-containing protein [Lophiotrema nucula]|uniref:RTA1 like protein-domain-containing protein n=1 Tax=Lophiotrema nucula TaxID=690887 RepID=A0A6A5Z5N6_9PLEO|nr:RTA1 like protein-domain-containing protein [Lophiotrema nucula]